MYRYNELLCGDDEIGAFFLLCHEIIVFVLATHLYNNNNKQSSLACQQRGVFIFFFTFYGNETSEWNYFQFYAKTSNHHFILVHVVAADTIKETRRAEYFEQLPRPTQ